MYKILLATDGSRKAKKALQETIRLATLLEAEVTVVSVLTKGVLPIYYAGMEPDRNVTELQNKYDEIVREATNRMVEEAVKPLRERGISTTLDILTGDAGDAIARYAEVGEYDLIIMGSRGLTGADAIFLGSVSNKVAQISSRNVLIIK